MTDAGIFRRRAKGGIFAFVVVAAPMAHVAAAQDRPGPAVELAAGWVGFADDGMVSEGLVAGAARWYLLPRFSVGPEFVYLQGTHRSHLVLTGNVMWDVLGPMNRHPRPVTPFLVAGGGLFQTRERFFNGTFTSSEGAFTVGGGVRALVGDRVTVGLELRLGWETHFRINGLVGLHLGR
jgi:outer membrane protein with beta-barrel domain